MIYPGTDLKFRISQTVEEFSLADHNFAIDIVTMTGHVRQHITKQEMFSDADGNWYFTLENVRSGPIYARFYAEIPDDDYDKLCRIVTDHQLLCNVGRCDPYADENRCACRQAHKVRYTQVWTVNLDDGTYLIDADGAYVLDADGARILVSKADAATVPAP